MCTFVYHCKFININHTFLQLFSPPLFMFSPLFFPLFFYFFILRVTFLASVFHLSVRCTLHCVFVSIRSYGLLFIPQHFYVAAYSIHNWPYLRLYDGYCLYSSVSQPFRWGYFFYLTHPRTHTHTTNFKLKFTAIEPPRGIPFGVLVVFSEFIFRCVFMSFFGEIY